jgi:tripartite-type tricarboxylate transporter receptor subunit TctC
VKDFTPISLLVTYSNVLLTHFSVKAKNLKELVAFAKANPGMLSFATAGSGSGAHLAAELFKRAAGIDILIVHYKGAAPATNDLVGGHVKAMFNNPLSATPLVNDGKVRVLATTGLKRSPTMPDVPTVAESGYPGFKTDTWFGVIGPAGLHRDIVSKVSRDTGAIIAMDDVRKSLMKMGLEPASSTPEQLAQILREDNRTYGALIRETIRNK